MHSFKSLLASLLCFACFGSLAQAQNPQAANRLPADPPLQLSAELSLVHAPPGAGIAAGVTSAAPSPVDAAPSLPSPLTEPLTQGSQDRIVIRDPSTEIKDDLPPLPAIDLTTPPDDLWQRIRNGFSMPNLDSPLVADRQAWYLNRPKVFKVISERSRRYLFYIVEELQKRGMPTELALLPIVESSYNPLAHSPARALGMWQFIPSTGKNYNLQQNWWLDQRRDIIASTSAALDYLQNIYEMHGDWHLALASYNWGEHAVARAIAKNQAKGLPTDYSSLTMPGETRYYVPKLQALKNIIAEPELFGIHLDPIPNKPYFGSVDLFENMDISTAAKLAETPLEEFIALNPSYYRPVIPGENRSPMLLPADKVQTFLANLERHEQADKPLSNWTTYSLKKGEKLDAVAARNGLTLARLKQLNGITPKSKIGPGYNLLIPANSQAQADPVADSLPKMPSESRSAGRGKKGKKGSAKGGGRKSSAKATAKGGRKAPVAKGKPAGKAKPAAKKKR